MLSSNKNKWLVSISISGLLKTVHFSKYDKLSCYMPYTSLLYMAENGHIKMSAQSYITLLPILYGRERSYKIDGDVSMSC